LRSQSAKTSNIQKKSTMLPQAKKRRLRKPYKIVMKL